MFKLPLPPFPRPGPAGQSESAFETIKECVAMLRPHVHTHIHLSPPFSLL
jgi:hypothetical protein